MLKEMPKCLVCSKDVKHQKNKTCSAECREELKKQNGSFSASHEKKRQTMLLRYGVENPAHSKISQTKRISTMIKKYGAKVSPIALEKTRARSNHMNKVSRQTLMEKYGVMNPGQLPNHREKCIKTLQENFGVDNYFKSQEWQEKSLQNIIEFYKNLSPSNINVIEILEPEQYLIDNHKGPIRRIRFSCNKCNKEEIISVGAFEFRIDKFKDACATCMGISRGTSAGEKQVVAYIKSIYSGEVLENDRKLIYRKELDIVLPDLKLAFEYNGVFYHGNRRIDDPKYHIEKIDRCDTVGFRLVNLFEDEWLFKRNIVEKRIRYLLGLETNKLYARKCDVKEITSAEARQFVEANHIQGYVNAKVKLGLFYEGNLVSVMTFSRPNISKGKHKSFDSWEIGRFCSSTNVVGGASKLLTYFKQAYKPETIFTYSDRRWDTGKLYETLGFEFVGHTKPNYWYVKGYQRYHRFSLRKNKDDDPTLTEWQNRQLQGWNRIWDCGHAKWVWKES